MTGERAEAEPAQPSRRGMALRIVAIALAACAALGSFVVFEAASKTGLANVAANAASSVGYSESSVAAPFRCSSGWACSTA